MKNPRTGRGRLVRSSAVSLSAALALGWTGACASVMPSTTLGLAPTGTHYATLSARTRTATIAVAPVAARTPDRRASTLYAPNVAIGDSLLLATVIHLRALSPAFDSAMAAVEASGIPVVIGTEAQLRSQLPPGYGSVDGWQALTAVYPLTPSTARGRPIEHVAVIVRLAPLREALRQNGATHADTVLFERYVERVVAHEIYGHLMPQLALGKTAPIACDDPTSAADWYTACVMQRERHVMAQLVVSQGTFAAAATH